MRQVVTAGVTLFAVGLAGWVSNASGQQRDTGVKNLVQDVSGTNSLWAVVESIDADGMVVVQKLKGDKSVKHTFVPVDLLRDGKVLYRMTGDRAYRWQDVKKGDSVRVEVKKDDGDGKTYCLSISIQLRPGEELPASQDPKADILFNRRRIFNEITNGNDVSDEELHKEFPARVETETGRVIPGGVTGTLLEKLYANRKRIAEEKEKKELKAKSTDGKSDPKKDDKK